MLRGTSVRQVLTEGIADVLVSFCIPVLFSIAYLPVIYFVAVKALYHDLFVLILIRNKDGENLVESLATMIPIQSLEYLLDHHVIPRDSYIVDMLILDSDGLKLQALMQHGIEIPEQVMFNVFLSDKTVEVWLKNGGSPHLFSQEDEISLVDFCIRHDKKISVDLLRQYGAQSSPGAMSTREQLEHIIKFWG